MATIGEAVAQIRGAMTQADEAADRTRNADSKLGDNAAALRRSLDESSNPLPLEAFAAWKRAQEQLAEALTNLATASDTWTDYLAVLTGATGSTPALAVAEGSPPIRVSTRAIPAGWSPRPAESGKGRIWQRPGARRRNDDSIRIMNPSERYPFGYVRFYNQHGQPIGIDGKPGPRSRTHFPVRADGTYDQPRGWRNEAA